MDRKREKPSVQVLVNEEGTGGSVDAQCHRVEESPRAETSKVKEVFPESDKQMDLGEPEGALHGW